MEIKHRTLFLLHWHSRTNENKNMCNTMSVEILYCSEARNGYNSHSCHPTLLEGRRRAHIFMSVGFFVREPEKQGNNAMYSICAVGPLVFIF